MSSPTQSPASPPAGTLEDAIADSQMPSPGPDYYAARRALWLTPRGPPPQRPPPSPTAQRLETLLRPPEAVKNDALWASGLGELWKAINAGHSLSRAYSLNLIIKIIHAAWLRDETWPEGGVAPDPDDMLPDLPPSHFLPPRKPKPESALNALD